MASLVGDFNSFAMEESCKSSFLASQDEDVSKIRTKMISLSLGHLFYPTIQTDHKGGQVTS